MKRFASVLVLLGLVVGAASCGSSESSTQPRTKNAAATTTTTTVAAPPDVRLVSTAGLIGYPLKLVAESRSTPDMNFGFTTASTGCRVDNYLNFLYYDSATQGKCTVSVTKLPATPLLGTVSVLQRLVAKVVATTDVTFYPQSVSSGLSSGLVGFWPFNSSTSMGWNSVTGKVDLKVVGKPSFRQFGKFGGAVTLNGAGDYLAGNGSGDSVPNLPTANGKYTMSLWMLPNKFDSSRGLMGWGTYGSDGDRKTNAFRMKSDLAPATTEISGGLVNYWWGKDAAWDAYQYRMTYVDGQGRTVCCKSAFTETKWVHVAVTYDGKTRTIYYDGKMVASDVPGVANGVANKNFRIGATSISNKEFFSGSIDDAAVWNRALTSDEIAGLSKMSVGQNNPALPANFKPFVPTPCSEIGGFCEVGDKTPEGGTVFFVGDFVDQLNNQPMKYLAFAPDDLRSQIYGPGTGFVKGYESLCGGGSNPIPEADKSEIGWGRRNTVVISNFCKSGAADKVLEYEVGGVKDWFIPSERELNELCKYARGQYLGDTTVECNGTGALAPDWAMDPTRANFVSSTQGAVVNATLQLLGWAIGPLSDWVKLAVIVGQETGALDSIDWGDKQQWRVGYDFRGGSRSPKLSGESVQVRPVRAFGPGSQKPLQLSATQGKVGAQLNLSTTGGSGGGRVYYVVTDPGSAKCAASADRTSVTPSAVGNCTVVAVKAASEQYFRVLSLAKSIIVSQGDQAPLAVSAINAEVGVAFRPSVTGGSGTGAASLSIKDPGTAGCVFATGSVTDIVASAAGTCVLRAVKPGDTNYLDATPVDTTVTVAKRKQSALVVTSTAGGVDVEISLATTGGSGSGAVTFAVSDAGPTGCSIPAGTGSLVAGAIGQCKVIATKAGDATFDVATSASTVVTITNPICDEAGKRGDGSACQVGDTGPGGGRVFYVSPTPIAYADGISTGGTFLEVAPAGWSGSPNEPLGGWCRRNVGRAFGSDIGTGANNTFELVRGGCDANSATLLASNAVINGKDDWFMPSAKELNEVCKFMRRQAVGDPAVACNRTGSLRAPFIGGRSSGAVYVSSSEKDTAYGLAYFTVDFDTGEQRLTMQSSGFSYSRPIRAFGAQKPPTTTSSSSTTSTTAPPAQLCDAAGKRPDGSSCQVGDIGPAGGTVILSSPTAINAVAGVSAGGRFIEAAPAAWTTASMKDSAMPFGGCYDRTTGANATAVGSGAANTQRIAACGKYSIGQLALDLIVTNGSASFDDWFVPSRDEAVGIAAQRVRVGGLKRDGYVWTSSEIEEVVNNYRAAWVISMFDGAAATGQKNFYSAVLRPVRAFG